MSNAKEVEVMRLLTAKDDWQTDLSFLHNFHRSKINSEPAVSKNHLGDEVRYSRWGISDDYQMLIELVQKATKEVEKGTPPNSNQSVPTLGSMDFRRGSNSHWTL
jgi:hypothetical protein